MRRELLDILVDPKTGEQLSLVDDTGLDVIEEGILVSPTGSSYPIVRGVPRLAIGESYGTSFGLQWNRFARVQLDSAAGTHYSRQRFEEETRWSSTDIAGKWIVDVGCGSGRFAEIAASYGARVIAMDLSSAVDAAHRNLRHHANIHVIQADLLHMPVRGTSISGIYCIGVLQHTPDPLISCKALVGLLPAGGKFAFTIYGRGPLTRLHAKYLVRPLTRRMRPERLLALIERSMPALFPATSVLYSLPRVGRVFNFVIPVANYVDHYDSPADIRYQEAILDTFDMLSPRFDHPVKAKDVEIALAPLCQVLEFDSTRPVVVRGTRVGPD